MDLGHNTDRHNTSRFVELVSQSLIQFPKELNKYWRAFGIGVLVGMAAMYQPPSKFDSIINRASERAKEIVKQQSEASQKGSFATDRLHH